MKKVTVYEFTVEDQGKHIEVPSKRTAEGLAEVGGIAVAGTAEVVDSDELRSDGRYLPKRSGAHYPEH